MNTDLILQILQLALSLARAQLNGQSAQNLSIDQILIEIVQKGAQAYQLRTGEPMNLSLIQAEAEI